MYDPWTVAFEIRSPIGRKSKMFPEGYHEIWITIWHVDPETDGTDDSCDWFGHRHTHENGWYPAAVNDYNSMSEEARQAIDFVWWMWRSKLGRPWWRHPRWHFWHWKIRVGLFTDLKRWLWSRCSKCGKRFRWGYAPVSCQWDNDGPRWFRGEKQVFHQDCYEIPLVE